MNPCERFAEIIAAGDSASARARAWADEHARECADCVEAARAFAAWEESAGAVDAAPAGFGERALARLAAEKRAAALRLARPKAEPPWLWAAAAAVAAGVVGAVVGWFISTPASSLADAVSTWNGELALTLLDYGNILGALAACAAALGALGYYYLVPRR